MAAAASKNKEKQDEESPKEVIFRDEHGSWELIENVTNTRSLPATLPSIAAEAKEMTPVEEEPNDKDQQKTQSSLSESLTPTSIDEASSFESEEDDDDLYESENYDDIEKGLVILCTG